MWHLYDNIQPFIHSPASDTNVESGPGLKRCVAHASLASFVRDVVEGATGKCEALKLAADKLEGGRVALSVKRLSVRLKWHICLTDEHFSSWKLVCHGDGHMTEAGEVGRRVTYRVIFEALIQYRYFTAVSADVALQSLHLRWTLNVNEKDWSDKWSFMCNGGGGLHAYSCCMKCCCFYLPTPSAKWFGIFWELNL